MELADANRNINISFRNYNSNCNSNYKMRVSFIWPSRLARLVDW